MIPIEKLLALGEKSIPVLKTCSQHLGYSPGNPNKTEKAFRKYEQVLLDIVQNWPRQTLVEIPLQSPETTKARLRDAWKAVMENPGWETLLDRGKLARIWTDKIVASNESNIVMVFSKSLKTPTAKSSITTESLRINSEPLSVQYYTHNPTAKEITSWLLLFGLGKLTGQLTISGLLDAEALDLAIANYPNLEVITSPNGDYIII